jgi:hypothetical protein
MIKNIENIITKRKNDIFFMHNLLLIIYLHDDLAFYTVTDPFVWMQKSAVTLSYVAFSYSGFIIYYVTSGSPSNDHI